MLQWKGCLQDKNCFQEEMRVKDLFRKKRGRHALYKGDLMQTKQKCQHL